MELNESSENCQCVKAFGRRALDTLLIGSLAARIGVEDI